MSRSETRQIHELQQAIKKKDLIIKKKDQKITTLENKLDSEDRRWYAHDNTDRRKKPGKSQLLDIHKTFDGIINDKKRLHKATKKTCKQFDYILKIFMDAAKKYPDAPLFSSDKIRRGNRCKLHIRHVLLLVLMSERLGITQDGFSTLFNVDQSTISRYLEFAKVILLEILPTAENISEEIQDAKNIDEVKHLVPGSNGGELYIDGTHIAIERPSDPAASEVYYIGRKKKHTLNITIVANRDKLVIATGKPMPGSMPDLDMFRDNEIDLGPLSKSMNDENVRKKDKVTVYVDKGYQAIEGDLPGANVQKPTKKPKNAELDGAQKNENKRISNIRIKVEHAICRLKQYKILAKLYVGTDEDLRRDLLIVTGLANFDLLWDAKRERLKHGF